MTRIVVIYGTGGMGREAAAWLGDVEAGGELIGFLDDDPTKRGQLVAGLTVLGGVTWLIDQPRVRVVTAIGSPAGRARLLTRLDDLGAKVCTIIHPTAVIGPRTVIDAGAIVCPGAVLTCDVTVGRGVIVNYGAKIGHDSVIGDAAFIAPGVHLAGNVTVGAQAEVGIGASVIQGVRIGERAVVGAGAVVVDDVLPDTTVVGVPARPIVRSR